MHYSRSIKAAIASTVFGAVTTVGMTAAMAQTELRLHTFVPPGHIIYTTILEPLAEQIAAESNGTLTLTLYPAMQLGGGAPELIRQAVEGTVDMAFSLPGYTSAQFPRTQMIELPSLRAEGMATTELMWDLLEGGYLDPEFDGLKVLALWAADDAGLYTRDKPIRSLDDVAGLLLRSPSAAQAGQIERMGGTPVAMPIPELYPQLERGVIDGALVPFTTILDFRMHEVANYFTITGPLFGRSQFTVDERGQLQQSFGRASGNHRPSDRRRAEPQGNTGLSGSGGRSDGFRAQRTRQGSDRVLRRGTGPHPRGSGTDLCGMGRGHVGAGHRWRSNAGCCRHHRQLSDAGRV